MKNYKLLIAGSLSFFAIQQSFGDELRSSQAKAVICAGLEGEFADSGVKAEDCLQGTFNVTEEKRDTIGNRERSTLIKVDSSFDDKKFSVTLKKELYVSNTGKVTIGKWLFEKVNTQELGNASIIEKSNVGDSNVKKLTDAQYDALPEGVKNWWAYAEAPDFELDSIVYYKITRPNSREVIGYIVEESSHSEEAGYRALVTAKFDLNGEMIGEISEDTWGLDE